MERWEHMQITAVNGDLAALPASVEDLGCYGWELVGFVPAPAVGERAVVAMLKRPMVLPHDPHERSEGWKADPCGHWELRWWDGQAWTFRVGKRHDSAITEGRDAPTMLPVFKTPTPPTEH